MKGSDVRSRLSTAIPLSIARLAVSARPVSGSAQKTVLGSRNTASHHQVGDNEVAIGEFTLEAIGSGRNSAQRLTGPHVDAGVRVPLGDDRRDRFRRRAPKNARRSLGNDHIEAAQASGGRQFKADEAASNHEHTIRACKIDPQSDGVVQPA